jgi:hypothetical protein
LGKLKVRKLTRSGKKREIYWGIKIQTGLPISPPPKPNLRIKYNIITKPKSPKMLEIYITFGLLDL